MKDKMNRFDNTFLIRCEILNSCQFGYCFGTAVNAHFICKCSFNKVSLHHPFNVNSIHGLTSLLRTAKADLDEIILKTYISHLDNKISDPSHKILRTY